jgi:uncharacterized repeat protein (TIGR02543 family)
MKLRLLLACVLTLLARTALAQSYGYALYVIASAGGQVTSSPAGISCPGACDGSYAGGNITLTATASAGYTFAGWSGDCSGTGTCMLSMTDDHTVSAKFTSNAPSAVVPQTGFWYNPAEGGRGYVIEVHSNNNLFIGGFMYDANGNAVWYSSGPGAISGSTYTGTWQQYGNGETLTGSFQAATTVNNDVGNITLTFQSSTAGTLTLPDGRQIPIARYPF